MRSLASETRLLYAAEGGDLGRDGARIEADHAEFQPLADAPGTGKALGIEVGGEAEWGSIGDHDGLLFRLEAEERRDGAEGFFGGEQHVDRRFADHDRAGILAVLRHLGARGEDAAAFGSGVGDMLLDLLDRRRIDHRADRDALLGARTDLHGLDALRKLGGESVVDAGLPQDAVGADAGLAAIAEL